MLVEWAQTSPHFYIAPRSGEDLTVPPSVAAPPDMKPSRWSLSSAKRCIDLLVAAMALLLLWPLLLVVALIVRCDSPGPVIFRQKRVGRHGVLFTVFKFRTMAMAGQKEGPCLTRRGDPRVTRIGRLLRKYKLDELPQLWNVLCGQMSLIGPRPKLPHLDVMPMPFRPGLTGAATLVFRHEEEMLQDISDDDLEGYYCRMIKPLKSQIDWGYMREASLASDLALLYQTARCCVCTRADSVAIDFSELAKQPSRSGPLPVPVKQFEVNEMMGELDRSGHAWPHA